MMDFRLKYFISYAVFLTTIFPTPIYMDGAITGRRAPCTNENEDVPVSFLKNITNCFKCICKNGFVECETESCPAIDDCYILVKKATGGCCDKCKECVYKGVTYSSGTEWSHPGDPCTHFKCLAGVITESNLQCYTPCSNPQLPSPGQCCPTCGGCYLNGQYVPEGREVSLSEDPCVICRCTGNRLMCVKKACPVLQCPITKQTKSAGECCPRCTDRMKELHNIPGKCILARGFHPHGKQYNADLCSKCTCHNGTSVCRRNTCPVLECAPEYQEMDGMDCCPRCLRQAEVRSTCKHEGKVYQNNETWSNGPCRSCECRAGEIRCALVQCPPTPKCRTNEKLVEIPGQCCKKCVENPAVCTVYGDPHYKTFDGKHYSFQGSCKYQLTADCVDNTFAIRVTNDARNTKHSAWTKTVTLKMGYIKVNLGQKMRVKVNGTRVIDFPYDNHGINITKNKKEGITVDTDIGIRLSWDGNNFLQVEAATKYKNKLCGLCGNYNNVFRDDLKHKDGRNMSDSDVWSFANSWRVGGSKACTRRNDEWNRPRQLPVSCQKRYSPKCHPLTYSNHVFSECQSHLNPEKYLEACNMDMCECPARFCYCESFTAYARECQRLGVELPNWREQTNCTLQMIQQRTQQAIRQAKRHNRRKPWRTHRPGIAIPSDVSRYTNTNNYRSREMLIPPAPNRTPPPIH